VSRAYTTKNSPNIHSLSHPVHNNIGGLLPHNSQVLTGDHLKQMMQDSAVDNAQSYIPPDQDNVYTDMMNAQELPNPHNHLQNYNLPPKNQQQSHPQLHSQQLLENTNVPSGSELYAQTRVAPKNHNIIDSPYSTQAMQNLHNMDQPRIPKPIHISMEGNDITANVQDTIKKKSIQSNTQGLYTFPNIANISISSENDAIDAAINTLRRNTLMHGGRSHVHKNIVFFKKSNRIITQSASIY